MAWVPESMLDFFFGHDLTSFRARGSAISSIFRTSMNVVNPGSTIGYESTVSFVSPFSRSLGWRRKFYGVKSDGFHVR